MSINQEQYVTYEQALKLREFGYTESCSYVFKINDDGTTKFIRCTPEKQKSINCVQAPSIRNVRNWFLHTWGTWVGIVCQTGVVKPVMFGPLVDFYGIDKIKEFQKNEYKTPHECLVAGITLMIDILEQKMKQEQ